MEPEDNNELEIAWESYFTPRELKQIQFSEIYAKNFFHGADGHNSMIIISKMANILNGNPPVLPEEPKAVKQSS